jgi:hypothetical protein
MKHDWAIILVDFLGTSDDNYTIIRHWIGVTRKKHDKPLSQDNRSQCFNLKPEAPV